MSIDKNNESEDRFYNYNGGSLVSDIISDQNKEFLNRIKEKSEELLKTINKDQDTKINLDDFNKIIDLISKSSEQLKDIPFKDVIKTIPEPYGDIELIKTDYKRSLYGTENIKILACKELCDVFKFDPFQYAKDNNIKLSCLDTLKTIDHQESEIDCSDDENYITEAQISAACEVGFILEEIRKQEHVKLYSDKINSEKEKAKQAFIEGNGVFKKAIDEEWCI